MHIFESIFQFLKSQVKQRDETKIIETQYIDLMVLLCSLVMLISYKDVSPKCGADFDLEILLIVWMLTVAGAFH